MRTSCAKCGSPLEHPPTGRPKTYCGTACRRAAQFEIRRVTEAIRQNEETAAWLEEQLALGGPTSGSVERKQERLAYVREQIDKPRPSWTRRRS